MADNKNMTQEEIDNGEEMTVTLTLDDGREIECVVLTIFPAEGMGSAEGRKRRGASFPGYLSLEYTKRSSWLARLLPLYDYLAIFTADHRSLSQSRIKNLFTDS